jgi:nucleotide-binding universal stress UspA family protein
VWEARRELPSLGVRRILHATDFSSASGAAFKAAVEMARRDRAELLVLHVLSPPAPLVADAYVTPSVWTTLLRSQRASAERRLDALVQKARRARVRARGLLADGVPADRIVRTARASSAGMIIVGTHGRTGAARFFLGSVAGRVVAAAHCPVLTVRGR